MKINRLKDKIITCAIILIVAIVMYIFNIPCLFRALFGINCPGCGMTRAYISLFQLDFIKALEYNKMFWSVPVIFLFVLFDGKVFKNKWVNIIVEYGIYLLLFANWIIFKL